MVSKRETRTGTGTVRHGFARHQAGSDARRNDEQPEDAEHADLLGQRHSLAPNQDVFHSVRDRRRSGLSLFKRRSVSGPSARSLISSGDVKTRSTWATRPGSWGRLAAGVSLARSC